MKHSHKIGLAPTRGMTLIEIMIVVSIIAMVSAGIAVAAIGVSNDSRIKHAGTQARTVRNAVQSYWIMEATSDCPTPKDLENLRYLDEGSSQKDPWGEEYRIDCDGDRVRVTSPGPDKKLETEDDISVPPKEA